MRVVFAGTPDFAVPSLRALIDLPEIDVVAVYTQPDRPAGRGRKLSQSPVKQLASEAGIPVEQPPSLRRRDPKRQLRAYGADLMVVAAYGLILPQSVLDMPRLGCWNVHASLLPRWRGAAPIHRALLAGDTETGICIMQMEAGLDTGGVLHRSVIRVGAKETVGQLHDRLAELGADALKFAIEKRGSLTPEPQPEDGVTYAHKIETAEATIDWNQDAVQIDRQVRAFNPWPVARGEVAGEVLRIWCADPKPTRQLPPGEVEVNQSGEILVGTGSHALQLIEVQRPGGRRVSGSDYLNGRPDLRPSP